MTTAKDYDIDEIIDILHEDDTDGDGIPDLYDPE